jgi:hypothetical protein
MNDEPYSRLGLSASQLEVLLKSQGGGLLGEVVGIAFAGRGGVLWHGRQIRLVGPVQEEFRLAIAALLEDMTLESGTQVRDVLLSMGGARLVVHRLVAPRALALPQTGEGE